MVTNPLSTQPTLKKKKKKKRKKKKQKKKNTKKPKLLLDGYAEPRFYINILILLHGTHKKTIT